MLCQFGEVLLVLSRVAHGQWVDEVVIRCVYL
jgi:hypothetical protein